MNIVNAMTSLEHHDHNSGYGTFEGTVSKDPYLFDCVDLSIVDSTVTCPVTPEKQMYDWICHGYTLKDNEGCPRCGTFREVRYLLKHGSNRRCKDSISLVAIRRLFRVYGFKFK